MTGRKPASKLRKGLTAIFMTAVMGGAMVIGLQSHTPQNDNLATPAPITQTMPRDTVEAPYAYSGQVVPYESQYTIGDPSYSGYTLDSKYTFQSYGQIQQAQIMEDYALRFLHPARQSHWLPAEYGDDKSDTDPFLQTLVETQFPSAAEARAAFANVEVRGLTQGEAALLKGIFGGQIDTANIRLNLHPQDYSDIVGSVEADAVADFWGPENHSKDYSRDKDADKFGTFVHELTHNWQRQTEWKFTLDIEDNDKDKYSYPLNAKYSFPEYTTEQQAAIVEDYARRFLHPSHSHTYLQKIYRNPNAYDSLLIKVVEDQFPGAKQLREEYKRNEAAPRISIAPGPRASFG
ncbi:MAG: hypothetical protein K0R10_1606 [Alphaproteobacteria bacterium]|nr:hypothetical protein [Alphaproteobacteria bacterium]